jgi:hypothetical protein
MILFVGETSADIAAELSCWSSRGAVNRRVPVYVIRPAAGTELVVGHFQESVDFTEYFSWLRPMDKATKLYERAAVCHATAANCSREVEKSLV